MKGYVNIQWFMPAVLNLKPVEMIITSIIYGFSQDGESWFMGSTEYLVKWCNMDRKTVFRALERLLERGIIEKKEVLVNNKAKRCFYRFNMSCLENMPKQGGYKPRKPLKTEKIVSAIEQKNGQIVPKTEQKNDNFSESENDQKPQISEYQNDNLSEYQSDHEYYRNKNNIGLSSYSPNNQISIDNIRREENFADGISDCEAEILEDENFENSKTGEIETAAYVEEDFEEYPKQKNASSAVNKKNSDIDEVPQTHTLNSLCAFSETNKGGGRRLFDENAGETGDGKQRKLRKTSEPRPCLFENSRFAEYEDFEECFTSPEFEDVDLAYYYHAVADWSASKGKKQRDWIAQARNFMRRDKAAGRLQMKPEQEEPIDMEMLKMSITGDFGDY